MKNLVFIDVEASYSKDISSVCCVSLIMVNPLTLKEIEKTTYYINSEMIYDNYGKEAKVNIDINPLDIKMAPNMKSRYKSLKKYLNNHNIIVGHAVENDIRMLNAALKRYNLEPFTFDFFCSQMLYRLFRKDNSFKSLDKVAKEIGESFNHHHCEEDVLMSLKTIRYISKELSMPIFDILKKYEITLGHNENGNFSRISTSYIKQSKHKIIEEIYSIKIAPTKVIPYFENKTFVFDTKFEREDLNRLSKLISLIQQAGGHCSGKITEGDIFIDAYPQHFCRRKKYITNNLQLNIKIVDLKDILEKLNVKEL